MDQARKLTKILENIDELFGLFVGSRRLAVVARVLVEQIGEEVDVADGHLERVHFANLLLVGQRGQLESQTLERVVYTLHSTTFAHVRRLTLLISRARRRLTMMILMVKLELILQVSLVAQHLLVRFGIVRIEMTRHRPIDVAVASSIAVAIA